MRKARNPVVKATFRCSVCGRLAGSVQLVGTHEEARIRRKSFTSMMTGRIDAQGFEKLRRALVEHDAHAVYELDHEYMPFYCPACDACYCLDHWDRWDVFDEDGWHDSIRGRCPRNHERMLED